MVVAAVASPVGALEPHQHSLLTPMGTSELGLRSTSVSPGLRSTSVSPGLRSTSVSPTLSSTGSDNTTASIDSVLNIQQNGGGMELLLDKVENSPDPPDSIPPTYSRLPPDGHEFPEDYVDSHLNGYHEKTTLQDQELLSRKSSASSTASLDRHEMRLTLAGKRFSSVEDRSTGVRAKIAMFSHGKLETGKSSLGKFQSSEDIGRFTGFVNASLTRAHTQGDVRFEDGLKKQDLIKSLNSVNCTISEGSGGVLKGISSLKILNKNKSYRSMINVSSHREASNSPEDTTISFSDLTKDAKTIYEETEKPEPPVINHRSQSLNEIGQKKIVDIGSSGRSRSSNILGAARSSTVLGAARSSTVLGTQNKDPTKKSSMSVIEERRRSALSKLKGLVIPEGRESQGLENHESYKSDGSKGDAASTKLPNPPWKEKNAPPAELPKYSSAFKRKPLTVCSGNTEDWKPASEDTSDSRKLRPNLREDKVKRSPPVQLAYKPPIGKRNSDESLGLQARHEDSDNDSAVSSGRSSVSGRSSSPVHSPSGTRKSEVQPKTLETNPRVLKKNSVEAINRQNVINACKKRSATLNSDVTTPLSKSRPTRSEFLDPSGGASTHRAPPRTSLSRPASRSASFNIHEKNRIAEQGDLVASRQGSNSSLDLVSRRNSREVFDLFSRRSSRDGSDPQLRQMVWETSDSHMRRISQQSKDEGSRMGSRVTTPTGGNPTFPETILDIEEKVAYITDMVDRAASITPTDRRSLSRTNSVASERSTYSNRSSRNSSIVSEKAPFARTSSMLSKDSAISEDIGPETDGAASSRNPSEKWTQLEKKYSKSTAAPSIENKIAKLKGINEGGGQEVKSDRPKDLAISQKKSSLNSPSAKNFKELAEKWQTFSSDTTPTPTLVSPATTFATLPRKSSKEIPVSPTPTATTATLPRKVKGDRSEGGESNSFDNSFPWSPPSVKNSFYQVSGETEWSGFDMVQGKGDMPDRKFSVPVYNEATIKLREKKDNVPSRPSSLIESSEQKDFKIFEIGNLGDTTRMVLNSNSTSRSSSQADLLDCTSVNSDTPKSPLPSSSSREILEAFSNRNSRRAVSVNDIRRAFEKAEQSLSSVGGGAPRTSGLHTSSSHNRMSSLDSTTSEESSIPTPHFHGSVSSLASGHGGLKDHYGSITSLASSTSMISPQELQNLIDEANQSLEESGTPSHEIMVIVLHREFSGGSIGITLAGGADYECKEITVHKVITGSLADKDGRIQKGDRVLSINGRSTKGVTHREALSILKAPRAEVVLVLSRSRSVTPAERNFDPMEASFAYINSSRPPKILESPLDSKSLMSDLKFVDVPRGSPITVNLKKEGTGLGFSLEGGKDSPFGDRPMTIKKIFTGGAADKNGTLRVGDEILSVNCVDVTRMTRLEAWNYMKKLNDGQQTVVVRQKLKTVPLARTDLVHTDASCPVEKTH